MKRVVIESPHAGDVPRNRRYLRACMRDCLLRGEAPYASHGLYAQDGVLDDLVPEEREHGIQAGFAWRESAELTVVYTDLGISTGMDRGIKHAEELGRPIAYRTLDELQFSSFSTKRERSESAMWSLKFDQLEAALARVAVQPDYVRLAAVLDEALSHAQSGKGAERHATGQPFDDQPIVAISRLLGSNHGDLFQAIKKAQESTRMPAARARLELLGAINYLAAAVLVLDGGGK